MAKKDAPESRFMPAPQPDKVETPNQVKVNQNKGKNALVGAIAQLQATMVKEQKKTWDTQRLTKKERVLQKQERKDQKELLATIKATFTAGIGKLLAATKEAKDKTASKELPKIREALKEGFLKTSSGLKVISKEMAGVLSHLDNIATNTANITKYLTEQGEERYTLHEPTMTQKEEYREASEEERRYQKKVVGLLEQIAGKKGLSSKKSDKDSSSSLLSLLSEGGLTSFLVGAAGAALPSILGVLAAGAPLIALAGVVGALGTFMGISIGDNADKGKKVLEDARGIKTGVKSEAVTTSNGEKVFSKTSDDGKVEYVTEKQMQDSLAATPPEKLKDEQAKYNEVKNNYDPTTGLRLGGSAGYIPSGKLSIQEMNEMPKEQDETTKLGEKIVAFDQKFRNEIKNLVKMIKQQVDAAGGGVLAEQMVMHGDSHVRETLSSLLDEHKNLIGEVSRSKLNDVQKDFLNSLSPLFHDTHWGKNMPAGASNAYPNVYFLPASALETNIWSGQRTDKKDDPSINLNANNVMKQGEHVLDVLPPMSKDAQKLLSGVPKQLEDGAAVVQSKNPFGIPARLGEKDNPETVIPLDRFEETVLNPIMDRILGAQVEKADMHSRAAVADLMAVRKDQDDNSTFIYENLDKAHRESGEHRLTTANVSAPVIVNNNNTTNVQSGQKADPPPIPSDWNGGGPSVVAYDQVFLAQLQANSIRSRR